MQAHFNETNRSSRANKGTQNSRQEHEDRYKQQHKQAEQDNKGAGLIRNTWRD